MRNIFQSLSKILLLKRVYENSQKQLKLEHFDDVNITLYSKVAIGSLTVNKTKNLPQSCWKIAPSKESG